ncbi:MAG: AMP-binding protein [Burkholderiales bacterium]|nr:AMP-binding protein [Burkholderiales bacterium]
MSPSKLILDHVYDHEVAWRDTVYLTQPLTGGAVIDHTWGDVLDQARRMAAHLRERGLPAGARIAILSKNCAHFFIAELAIWMAGGTTVAIFPTEGPDTVRYVLEHSESSLLFVGKLDTWAHQKPGVPAGLPMIELPLAGRGEAESWSTIIARTEPLPGRPARAPDDIAMLIYTSGSTGQPKGVMHSFERISVACEGIVQTVTYTTADRFLSYLPLAHVFERAFIECATFVAGGHVYFAESLDTFVADLKRARPTLFISVPRLWAKFQHGVLAKMPAHRLDLLLRLPLVGTLVRRKVLSGLGLDHVRMAGSGSAPIPPELIAWYHRIGLNLLEGYAMSEDFAYSHLSRDGHSKPGYVGLPFPGVEVRIADDHEVLIRSPGQMVGYYKRPDLDAESFTADGFFRTGDLGERDADGMLRLTGRLKELFKTAKGKYVAPAPIENLINEHPIVEMSLVSGVGYPAAYAMVVLAEDLRGQVGDPAVRERVNTELAQVLVDVNRQVSDYQQLRMLVVVSDPWSIDNGLLTPTMKVKRARIEAAVAARLDQWYEQSGPVVWA